MREKAAEEFAQKKRREAEEWARIRAIAAEKESERQRIIRLWRTRASAAVLLGWVLFVFTNYEHVQEHNVPYSFAAIASLGWWAAAMLAFRSKEKRALAISGSITLACVPYIVAPDPWFIGPNFFVISFIILIYAFYSKIAKSH